MRTMWILAFGLLLVGFSHASLADKRSDCKSYAYFASNAARLNKDQRCSHTGGRWSLDHDHHLNWCLNLSDADWHFTRVETMARFDGLKACMANGPKWDIVSAKTIGIGTYSPGPVGEKACDNQGKIIIDAVAKVKANPSMFFDTNKDSGLYFTRYYYYFNHWNGFRCQKIVNTAPGIPVNQVRLDGYTGGPVDIRPALRPEVLRKTKP